MRLFPSCASVLDTNTTGPESQDGCDAGTGFSCDFLIFSKDISQAFRYERIGGMKGNGKANSAEGTQESGLSIRVCVRGRCPGEQRFPKVHP